MTRENPQPAQGSTIGQPVDEVVESISDAFFALDRDWRFTYLNRAAERLLGRPRADLLGRSAWEAFPEAVGSTFDREYRRAVAERVTVQFEEYFAPLATWFEVRAYPTPAGLSVYFQDVNDRRRMRDLLLSSEERHRALFETMDQGVVYQDAGGRIEYANPAAARILGLPTDRMNGRDSVDGPWVCVREDGSDLPGVDHPAMVALRTGEPVRGVVMGVFNPSAGEFRWISVNAVPLFREGSPSPHQAYTVFEDITQRKRSERALRRSEQRYRSLVDASSAIVWSTDARGEVVVDNLSWGTFTGQSPEEYRGWGWLDAVHPPDRERMAEEWGRSVEEKRTCVFEYRLLRRDGKYRLVVSRGVPVLDADGTLREWVGTCTDVTEARRWEEERRRNESLLSAMAHSSPLGIYVVDERTDAILFFNRRFFETWGIGHLEPRMRSGELSDSEVIPEALARVADPDAFAEATARLRDEPDREESVEEFALRDGRTIRRFSSRIRDDAGRYFGRLFLYEDVTDQRRAAESLRQAKEEAERASGAKDEFIAVLSHELRTPLTPVLLTASMMEAHPGLPDDLREDVATIRRNVEMESRLIGDLLDLTSIAKGKLELEFEAVDVHVAIRMAVAICQREEAIRLVAELDATRHVVRGDSTRLQQVFWNLLNNAQKFTDPSGSISVRTSDSGGGRVRVEVADTGAGIDPEVLPRLFDAFEQGDVRARNSFAGLGLGLAISRKLVAAHGGVISASSPGRGRGATFTVELPTIEEAAPQVAAPAPKRTQPAQSGALSVLLVEDHAATQRILARLLGKLGHRVATASSVASALAASNQSDFDLVLSDLGLPDGSGLDLMRQLRPRYHGRAIALTGYGMESDIRASLDAGFAEHLTKPVDFDALEASIARVLEGSSPPLRTPHPRTESA